MHHPKVYAMIMFINQFYYIISTKVEFIHICLSFNIYLLRTIQYLISSPIYKESGTFNREDKNISHKMHWWGIFGFSH